MQKEDFTHLHCHSVYSILDGENQLSSLVSQIKAHGMHTVALTDHGTMMGALEFYKECQKQGVKPIIGVEAYITNDSDGLSKEQMTKDNYHLVMVAQNNTGLNNLMWLVSNAQLNNYYYKPRISKSVMTPENLEGIIATSACLGNEVSRVGGWNSETRRYTNIDAMYQTAAWYKEAFNGRYYLEIQDNDDDARQQETYNAIVIEIGSRLGIPIVITSDAHYTNIQAQDTHSMLMAMQFKKTLEEYNAGNEMKYGPWFYLRSQEEMFQAAIKYGCEEAFWNACKIGSECNINIELGKYKTPVFDVKSEPDYNEFLQSEGGNK